MDGAMIQLLVWACGNRAQGLAKVFEELNQADLHPSVFSGQHVPSLVLQMSKTTDWDYCLGTAGMIGLPRSVYCKPLPTSLS